MGQVELTIGGRSHIVACRDGEEDTFRALGRRLELHAETAARASGQPSGERMMLFIALMLADELTEAEARGGAQVPPPAPLDHIADRLEALATALERVGSNP